LSENEFRPSENSLAWARLNPRTPKISSQPSPDRNFILLGRKRTREHSILSFYSRLSEICRKFCINLCPSGNSLAWARLNPRAPKISSHTSRDRDFFSLGRKRTWEHSIFSFYARLSEICRKFCINLFYLLYFWTKIYSTYNFINLHIQLTTLTHICSLNQSSSKIKQPILIKHHILCNLTNCSNTIKLIYITILTLSILNHKHFQ